MRFRNLVACLTWSILVFLALPGCHALYRDRPVSVLVRDAETKAPIPGAEVQIASASGHLPKVTAATTAGDGVARLKVNPTAEIAYTVLVDAAGYLSDEQDVSVEALRGITPAGGDSPTPTLVVEVFAGPRPTVELVVPTGYRGVLRAQVHGREDAPYPPGQRTFSYAVPANGAVEVVGPPVFLHGLAPDIRARYADGTPLSRDAKDNEVGLRWVNREGDEHIFVVGTRAEWDDLRKSLEKNEPRGHSAGKGGSRRGHGFNAGMGGIGNNMGGNGIGGPGGTGRR